MYTLSDRAREAFDDLLRVDPLTRRSVHPVEFSGCMSADRETGELDVLSMEAQNRDSSVTPRGGITFHTHNVPADTVHGPHMASDVPSWEDVNLIIAETVRKGLVVHLVVTPNRFYALRVDPERDAAVIERAEREGPAWIEGVYEAAIARNGRNHGRAFHEDWLGCVRDEIGLVDVVATPRDGRKDLGFPADWLEGGRPIACAPEDRIGAAGYIIAIVVAAAAIYSILGAAT